MPTSNLDTFTYIHSTNVYGAAMYIRTRGTKMNKMNPLKELADFLVVKGLH